MRKILPQNFFDQPTLLVARKLLGKYLVRKYRNRKMSLLITEVEAYDGPLDQASHASHGRTPRTKIMFGPAGRFYVYFIYGMHWLVNIVTGPENYPAAILIRAGIGYDAKKGKGVFINGPARLTKFLKITGAQNGRVTNPKTGLWIEDRGAKIKRQNVAASKRVGVDYAGSLWKNKLYRFNLKHFPKLGIRGSESYLTSPAGDVD